MSANTQRKKNFKKQFFFAKNLSKYFFYICRTQKIDYVTHISRMCLLDFKVIYNCLNRNTKRSTKFSNSPDTNSDNFTRHSDY